MAPGFRGGEGRCGVRRLLVVAYQTLGGDHLADLIRAHASDGPTSVLLLVPATHHTDLVVALAEAFAVQGGMRPPTQTHDADTDAQHRLAAGLVWLADLGVRAEGEVVGHDPVEDIRERVTAGGIDEVVISTLPAGLSRWLHHDLAHRVRRVTDLPVTVVTAERPDADPGEHSIGDRSQS